MNSADFQRIKQIFTQSIMKKGVSFTDFLRSKDIFMQPIVRKSESFADIRGYNWIYVQQIAKGKKSHVFQKIRIFFLNVFWQLVMEIKL